MSRGNCYRVTLWGSLEFVRVICYNQNRMLEAGSQSSIIVGWVMQLVVILFSFSYEYSTENPGIPVYSQSDSVFFDSGYLSPVVRDGLVLV